MTSQIKSDSSVVPIDVSGQPFSRMSSFRRSLINVDFFIRRKKKREKRRNTVTECDTKELENVLHKLINENDQHVLLTNIGNNEKNDMNSELNQQDKVNLVQRIEETNNNLEKVFIDHNIKTFYNAEEFTEQLKNGTLYDEDNKLDINSQKHLTESSKVSLNRRKLKGHIPISTISAAMSVAVEMRQMNGQNGSETVQPKEVSSFDYNSDNPSINEERKHPDYIPALRNHKRNRLKDTHSDSKGWTNATSGRKETQISNNTKSVNTNIEDNYSDTLAGHNVFLMSSDESDGGSSDIFKNNYGSSLSLSTLSNGSLNSLLSQTATEVTSSCVTLSSIGIESFPPTIAKDEVTGRKDSNKSPEEIITSLNESPTATIYKPSKKVKSKKLNKSTFDKEDTHKSCTDNSKSIFSSLVKKKPKSKDPCKLKSSGVKLDYMQNPPLINMYGCNSPKVPKQTASFIKENVSPVTENPRKCMQSFVTYHQSFQDKVNKKEQYQVIHGNSDLPMTGTSEISETNQISSFPTNPAATEVPMKYSHKVTVTPIQRHSMFRINKWRDESLSDNEEIKRNMYEPNKNEEVDRLHYFKENNVQPKFQRNQQYATLNTGTKLAARVLLDPEGRVIYCTNSLDRKPIPSRIGIPSNSINYQPQLDLGKEAIEVRNPLLKSDITRYESNIQSSNRTTHERMGSQTNYNIRNNRNSEIEKYQHKKEPSQSNIYSQTRSFRPTSLSYSGQKSYSELCHAPVYPNTPSSYQYSPSHLKNNSSLSSLPDPNISGLPYPDKSVTHHNNSHSSSNTPCASPLSTNSYQNPRIPQTSVNDFKTEQRNMSMEDLFAVIHNYKKRLNIKSDSDISLESSSSRSSSSSLRPSSSKGALVETGFLSPRSPTSTFNTSRDRRSWADFRPLSTSTPTRKSLASDRLGPPKPTSMHDFKMLLLQARSNNPSNGQRKSAVEMLKVSTSQDKSDKLTPSSPTSNFHTFSVPSSPSELVIHDGHTTVPFKRNNRARSSLQSRYTMYPPIFEDCSEDYEYTREIHKALH